MKNIVITEGSKLLCSYNKVNNRMKILIKKILLLNIILFLTISCASKKNLVDSTFLEDQDNDGISDAFDESPTIADDLTIDLWIKSRNKLVASWKEKLREEKIIKEKLDKKFSNFTIASTVIGVGSGIYGLVDKENIVPSIGSMLVGAGATLISQLNLNKKKETSNKCYNTISKEVEVFSTAWTDLDYPDDTLKFNKYQKDKNEVQKRIVEACYK